MYVYIYVYYNIYIYKSYPTHIEYGIEIVASPGIPGIELENWYLEYSWSPKSYT